MLPVSYLLTYRASHDPARRANLAVVMAWLASLTPAEIILVEQDATPSLEQGSFGPAKLVFAPNAGPFNKGWGFNIGARLATQPILCFGDADTFCHALPEAVKYARAGVPVVRPFTGIVDLDAAQSVQLRDNPALLGSITSDSRTTDRKAMGENTPLCGAIILMQRTIFSLLGGWDERFFGWGGEDDAMSVKVARGGIGHHILPATDGFHLHHARATPTKGKDSLYRTNLDLLQQVRTMPEEDLKRMCEVQWQLAGNPRQFASVSA